MDKALRSVGGGLLTVFVFFAFSGPVNEPRSVGISNLRDNGFTVTWWTTGVETGQVELSGGEIYEDVRGAAYTGVNHYVNVDGLKAGTSYTFAILSGGERFDHEGMFWQVTTGDQLVPRAADRIRGRVRNKDGSFPANVIVYVMLERLQHGTVSTLRSVLLPVGTDRFEIDLGQARLYPEADYYFEYSVQGDRPLNNGINILAMSPDGSAAVTLDIADPRLRALDEQETLVIHLDRPHGSVSGGTGTSIPTATSVPFATPAATALPSPLETPHICPRMHEKRQ